MELKIATTELSRALGRSQGIVEKKSTMPILSHVLLEAKKGQLDRNHVTFSLIGALGGSDEDPRGAPPQAP